MAPRVGDKRSNKNKTVEDLRDRAWLDDHENHAKSTSAQAALQSVDVEHAAQKRCPVDVRRSNQTATLDRVPFGFRAWFNE